MIRFLAVDDVNRLHDLTIRAQGGSVGIRDSALLDAAVAMPMQSSQASTFTRVSPPWRPPTYFTSARPTPTWNGNKRTAVLASLVFLTINQSGTLPSPEALESIAMAVARGELSKEELVEWFEKTSLEERS